MGLVMKGGGENKFASKVGRIFCSLYKTGGWKLSMFNWDDEPGCRILAQPQSNIEALSLVSKYVEISQTVDGMPNQLKFQRGRQFSIVHVYWVIVGFKRMYAWL